MSTKVKKDKGVKNDPFRFEGAGISFKGKLIGSEAVSDARGDQMCADAMSRLKSVVKASGEHKQRVSLSVSLEGIKVFDEKTHELMCHHPVHRISFISQDQTDPRAFGYVSGTPQGGHSFIAIKTEKAASQIVIALRDLFQVVLEMKQHEMKRRNGSATHQGGSASASNTLTGKGNSKRLSSSSSAAHDDGHEDVLLFDPESTNIADILDKQRKPASSDEAPREVAVVDDLLDLQTELDSLQQGIEQIEGEITTAEAAFGADPFGSTYEGPSQATASSMLESNGSGGNNSTYFQPNKVCLPPVSPLPSGALQTSGSGSTSNFSPAQASGANIVNQTSLSGQNTVLLPPPLPPPASSLPSTPKRTRTRRGGGSTSSDLFGSSVLSSSSRAASAAFTTGTDLASSDVAGSSVGKAPYSPASALTLPKGFTQGASSANWADSGAGNFIASSSHFGFGDSFDSSFASSSTPAAGHSHTTSLRQHQRQQQQQRNAGVTGLFSQTARGPSTAPAAPSNQTQFSFENTTLPGGAPACALPPPPTGGQPRGPQQTRGSATSTSSSCSTGADNRVQCNTDLNSVTATGCLAETLARSNLQNAPIQEAFKNGPLPISRDHTAEVTSNTGVISTVSATAPVQTAPVAVNGGFNAVFEHARPNAGLIGHVAPATSIDSVFDDFRFDGPQVGPVAPSAHQAVQREAHFSAAQFSFESVASSTNLSRGRTQESTELFDPPSSHHLARFDSAPVPIVSGQQAPRQTAPALPSGGVRSSSSALCPSVMSFGSTTVHGDSGSSRFMPAFSDSPIISPSPPTTSALTGNSKGGIPRIASIPPADKYAVFEELKQEEQAAAAPAVAPAATTALAPTAASNTADLFADFNAFGASPTASTSANVPLSSPLQTKTTPPSQRSLTSDTFFSDSGITGKSSFSSADGGFANFDNSASSGFGSIFESNFMSSSSSPPRSASTNANFTQTIQTQARNSETTVNDFFGDSTVAFEANFDAQFPTQPDVQSGGDLTRSSGPVLMSHGSTTSNGSETGSAKRPPMLNAAMRSNPFCGLSTESTPSEDFNTASVSSCSAAQTGFLPGGQVSSAPRGQKGVTSSSNDNSVCSPSDATTATNAFVSAASSPSSDRFVTMASGSSLSSSENDLTSSSPPPTVAPAQPAPSPSPIALVPTSSVASVTQSSAIPPAGFPPFAFDAPVAPAVTFASPVAVIPSSPGQGSQIPSKGQFPLPNAVSFLSSMNDSHKIETTPGPRPNFTTAANPFSMGSFTVHTAGEQQQLPQLSTQNAAKSVPYSCDFLESEKDEGFSGSNASSVSPCPSVPVEKSQQPAIFPSATTQNHTSVSKVSSCALESRNASAGIPFGQSSFVAQFSNVFGNGDGAQSTGGTSNSAQAGIFSKKDDPFDEDFFNMLNSSAGPDATGQQQQIDSFW